MFEREPTPKVIRSLIVTGTVYFEGSSMFCCFVSVRVYSTAREVEMLLVCKIVMDYACEVVEDAATSLAGGILVVIRGSP